MNYDTQNVPNSAQNNLPNDSEPTEKRSEEVQNRSEETQKRSERNTETFRSVPNETQNVPNVSEQQDRTAPSCSDEESQFTITVREAARIFEEAGVPRTERALTNWCNVNSKGVIRLDCCYSDMQHRYYITPQSIDQIIKEERNKLLHRGQQNQNLYSSDAEALTEHVRNETQNGSEEVQNGSEQNAETFRSVPNESKNIPQTSATHADNLNPKHESTNEKSAADEPLDKKEKDALKDLQMENYELKVQLEGQKYLIRKFDELVDGERGRHEKEKLALVDRLTDARHQVGSLEEKMLQIEAPKGAVRDVVIDDENIKSKSPSQKQQYESRFGQDNFASSA